MQKLPRRHTPISFTVRKIQLECHIHINSTIVLRVFVYGRVVCFAFLFLSVCCVSFISFWVHFFGALQRVQALKIRLTGNGSKLNIRGANIHWTPSDRRLYVSRTVSRYSKPYRRWPNAFFFFLLQFFGGSDDGEWISHSNCWNT